MHSCDSVDMDEGGRLRGQNIAVLAIIMFMSGIGKFYAYNQCRVSKKKWDLFYDQYLHQIKHKSAGYIFDFKGGIHRSVWSTKHFCPISGSQGKSKTILTNRFQELEIINNLISLNLIPS